MAKKRFSLPGKRGFKIGGATFAHKSVRWKDDLTPNMKKLPDRLHAAVASVIEYKAGEIRGLHEVQSTVDGPHGERSWRADSV